MLLLGRSQNRLRARVEDFVSTLGLSVESALAISEGAFRFPLQFQNHHVVPRMSLVYLYGPAMMQRVRR